LFAGVFAQQRTAPFRHFFCSVLFPELWGGGSWFTGRVDFADVFLLFVFHFVGGVGVVLGCRRVAVSYLLRFVRRTIAERGGSLLVFCRKVGVNFWFFAETWWFAAVFVVMG
jgi:hypothetical protein